MPYGRSRSNSTSSSNGGATIDRRHNSLGMSGPSPFEMDASFSNIVTSGELGEGERLPQEQPQHGDPSLFSTIFIDLTNTTGFLSKSLGYLGEITGAGDTEGGGGAAGGSRDDNQNGGKSIIPAYYAACAAKASISVLSLAILIPYIISETIARQDGQEKGILEGIPSALDAITITYLVYVAASITLSPLLGMLIDANAAFCRRPALLTLLALLAHGSIALLIIVSLSQSPSLPALSAILAILMVFSTLLSILLHSYLPDLELAADAGADSHPRATISGKAGLVHVIIAIIIGIVVLSTSAAASAVQDLLDLQVVRKACLTTVVLTNCFAVLAVMTLPRSIPITTGTTTAAGEGPACTGTTTGSSGQGEEGKSVVTFRGQASALWAGMKERPLLVPFLLARTFYQGAIRCLCYLAAAFMLQDLHLSFTTVSKSIFLALVCGLPGALLTLNLGNRRSGQEGGVTKPLGKTPLVGALAVLITAMSICPKRLEGKEKDDSGGKIYVCAAIWGIAAGFLVSYDQVLIGRIHGSYLSKGGGPATSSAEAAAAPTQSSSFLTNSSEAEHRSIVEDKTRIGRYSLCVLASSSLEWLPPLLYAIATTRKATHGTTEGWSIWILVFFLAIGMFLLLAGVNLHATSSSPSSADMPQQSQQRPGAFRRRLSGLLRTLPSHLSAIAESPSGVPPDVSSYPSSMLSPTVTRTGGGSV